jgi:transposase-like protein
MDRELRVLREQIARAPRNGRGYRQYAEELKFEVAGYARRSRKQGHSYAKIAKKLGLPAATLLHWRGKAGKPSKKLPIGFRPVALQAGTAATSERGTGPVVVLANGIRIEGLTASELTELVRGLS